MLNTRFNEGAYRVLRMGLTSLAYLSRGLIGELIVYP